MLDHSLDPGRNFELMLDRAVKVADRPALVNNRLEGMSTNVGNSVAAVHTLEVDTPGLVDKLAAGVGNFVLEKLEEQNSLGDGAVGESADDAGTGLDRRSTRTALVAEQVLDNQAGEDIA